MSFTYEAKQPGDMLRSQDWNAAMKEIERLEDDKINRAGNDQIKGSLTIAEALSANSVGVGTASPSEKLEIKLTGGDRLQTNFLSLHNDGGGATQESRIVWKNGTGAKLGAAIASRPGSGYNQGDLRFQTAKDGVLADRMLITHEGNVGIGSLAPKSLLDLRRDTAGALSVILTLQNGAGGTGAGGAIDFSGYDVGTNAATARLRSLDDGNFSSHLAFYTKTPGAAANPLAERFRIHANGNVGIGTTDPKGKLSVVGTVSISNGASHAVSNSHMASGSLTIGSTDTSYGGGSNWNSNTAGLLLETFTNTEIAVHDSSTRVASLMYYEGDAANRVTIGRDMGWGTLSAVDIRTGGSGNWNRLVVNATGEWGDSGNSYVTIGSGGADGIMLSNPHVTWRNSRASIRYGRSGGVSSGSYWDVGVRSNNAFSFSLNGDSDHKLWLTSSGNVGIGTTSPDLNAKLDIEGAALLGYEYWVDNFGKPLKSGFYQNDSNRLLPDTSHGWSHLITTRHSNANNNHQLQIAASYQPNDRLFFRKIAAGLETSNPGWNEVATRGANTFSGDQFFHNNISTSSITVRDTSISNRYMNIFFESGNGTIIFYHQNGQGQFMRQDGVWQRNSDSSLKENVVDLQGILEKTMQLRPVGFRWKSCQTEDMGFIAQEIEQIFPELVGSVVLEQQGNQQIKGIAYSTLGVIAIAALQEMKKTYDEKIKVLEAKLLD